MNAQPMRTLLRAAGITDFTTEGDYNNGTQSFRYAGIVLQARSPAKLPARRLTSALWSRGSWTEQYGSRQPTQANL